jgi:hypothetical protein
MLLLRDTLAASCTLRVVLMSATADPGLFARYFDAALAAADLPADSPVDVDVDHGAGGGTGAAASDGGGANGKANGAAANKQHEVVDSWDAEEMPDDIVQPFARVNEEAVLRDKASNGSSSSTRVEVVEIPGFTYPVRELSLEDVVAAAGALRTYCAF